MNRSGMAARSLSSVVSSDIDGDGVSWQLLNTFSPNFGAIVCTADDEVQQKAGQIVIAFVQRQPRDPHPFLAPEEEVRVAIHSLTSVVLPKPAGAEMSASLRCRPSLSRSIKRGRGTALGRGGGMYSLVAKTGTDMVALYNARAIRSPHATK